MYDPLEASPLMEIYAEPLTKAQRKKMRREARRGFSQIVANNFQLMEVTPKSVRQREAFEAFFSGYQLLLHGVAGTGKTFIALYLALNEIMQEGSKIDKVVIVRSAVPTRDIGFLPGTAEEKLAPYEQPYELIFNELFDDRTAYEQLKKREIVQFMPTSFIRGITIENAVVIVEEMQNMTGGELNSVITRLGRNTRLILCGDHRQNDLEGKKQYEQSGLKEMLRVLTHMKSVAKVEFGIDDVQRSGFVKEYLRARLELGLDAPLDV